VQLRKHPSDVKDPNTPHAIPTAYQHRYPSRGARLMSEKKAIRQYREPAGGWGALRATGKALTEQGIPISGSATLLRMNQPEDFDCPGCAWPDPKHTSSFEFCENGAKAVA
jgi:hypothetical protein